MLIGNPLLEFNTDFNSRGQYLWSHGLLSDTTMELLLTACNVSEIMRQTVVHGELSATCANVNSRMNNETGSFTNPYDVTADICLNQQTNLLRQKLQPKEEVDYDVCIAEKTAVYLNREEVQRALNARIVGKVGLWTECNRDRVITYDLGDMEVPTLPLLGTLTKAGIAVLIFSGDQDSVLSLIGTRVLLDRLAKELGLEITVPYTSWSHDEQVAGWTQVYGNILTFATVRGAAHEVPLTQPARSLGLFRSFLHGMRLSSPLPLHNTPLLSC